MQRNKYSPEEKVAIVESLLHGKENTAGVKEKYGISKGRLREWVLQYKANGIGAFLPQKQNKNYSEDLKIQVVTEYLNGEGSTKELSAKYGLRSDRQLRNWIKVYNSGRGFQRKMTGGSRMKETRPTTVEERIQIAQDCIANGRNYGETALKFNVSYQQVYQWVKKYKNMGDAGLEDRRGKRKKDQNPRTELEKAQIEIERLKHELYMTQMERDLLKKLNEIERREAYRK